MFKRHLTSQLAQLLPDKNGRFAIAFSGGGDSTALVHALKDHPQRGPVFIVDHALRLGSKAEAQAAKSFAQSCGYETNVLTWDHNAPQTGLQEKARRARYGLMGDACRNLGIEYLLTAHNQDDQAETLLMRYDKQTDWRGAAGIAVVSHAPVWPELAMVNICRPVLDVSRQELRDYNLSHNLAWAEDPSNENRDYSRIRARDYLKNHAALKSDLLETARELARGVSWEHENLRTELDTAEFGPAGDITFHTLPSLELLGLALRCVGGGGMPIPRQRLAGLYHKLKTDEVKALTLRGAQAVKEGERLILSRDLVAVTGRRDIALKPRAMSMSFKSEPQIWDGRFFVSSKSMSSSSVSSNVQNFKIRANYGVDLPRSKRLKDMLATLHKSVRQTCPVIIKDETAFAVDEIKAAKVISLVKPRLVAALSGKNITIHEN